MKFLTIRFLRRCIHFFCIRYYLFAGIAAGVKNRSKEIYSRSRNKLRSHTDRSSRVFCANWQSCDTLYMGYEIIREALFQKIWADSGEKPRRGITPLRVRPFFVHQLLRDETIRYLLEPYEKKFSRSILMGEWGVHPDNEKTWPERSCFESEVS